MLLLGDWRSVHAQARSARWPVHAFAVAPLAQVEDMLKRSFLEFHAQKAAPEAAKALARGQSALAALRAAPWPLPELSRAAVAEYVAINARIEALARQLQVRCGVVAASGCALHAGCRGVQPAPKLFETLEAEAICCCDCKPVAHALLMQAALMASRATQAALAPGRMLLLGDLASGLPQLAVLLSSPSPSGRWYSSFLPPADLHELRSHRP